VTQVHEGGRTCTWKIKEFGGEKRQWGKVGNLSKTTSIQREENAVGGAFREEDIIGGVCWFRGKEKSKEVSHGEKLKTSLGRK